MSSVALLFLLCLTSVHACKCSARINLAFNHKQIGSKLHHFAEGFNTGAQEAGKSKVSDESPNQSNLKAASLDSVEAIGRISHHENGGANSLKLKIPIMDHLRNIKQDQPVTASTDHGETSGNEIITKSFSHIELQQSIGTKKFIVMRWDQTLVPRKESMADGPSMHASLKKMGKGQARSMLGSAPQDTEEAVDTMENDAVEDIVVMDYALPHRKPPIHNERP